MGVVPSVLEIPLLSKTAKFPFRTMGYSPWSSKNLINRNQLRKFMQVGIDVTCMYTKFGGRGLSKNLIDLNWLRKFILVGIDVTCMYTEFGGRSLSSFGDTATLKNGQISLSDHGLQSMVFKKFNRSELDQKIYASKH